MRVFEWKVCHERIGINKVLKLGDGVFSLIGRLQYGILAGKADSVIIQAYSVIGSTHGCRWMSVEDLLGNPLTRAASEIFTIATRVTQIYTLYSKKSLLPRSRRPKNLVIYCPRLRKDTFRRISNSSSSLLISLSIPSPS